MTGGGRRERAALAVDMAGAVRSGVGAMLAAAGEWKFGFVASRCEACGARQLPPPDYDSSAGCSCAARLPRSAPSPASPPGGSWP
jgi:hypothetical protein